LFWKKINLPSTSNLSPWGCRDESWTWILALCTPLVTSCKLSI